MHHLSIISETWNVAKTMGLVNTPQTKKWSNPTRIASFDQETQLCKAAFCVGLELNVILSNDVIFTFNLTLNLL